MPKQMQCSRVQVVANTLAIPTGFESEFIVAPVPTPPRIRAPASHAVKTRRPLVVAPLPWPP